MDERRRQILRSLLQLAHADGLVVAEEERLLHEVLRSLGGTGEELLTLEESLAGACMVPLEEFLSDPAERRRIVRLLVDLSMCDGSRSFSEETYVAAMANRLGISYAELQQIQVEAEAARWTAEAEALRVQADAELRRLHLPQ